MIASDDGPPDPVTRHVLQTFARWVKRDGERAAVSQSILARQTALGKRTVQRHMQRAVATGWLEPDGHKADPRGRWLTPRYRIRIPNGCQSGAGVSERHRGAPRTPEGASQSARQGCQSGTLNGVVHISDTTRAHARGLENLNELARIRKLNTRTTTDLELLDQIEREGGHVNGIDIAQQAREVRAKAIEEETRQC